MLRFAIVWFFFSVQPKVHEAEATAIDNGVEGEPVIFCGANDVSFSVSTRKPFEGKVFVKGEYAKPDCTANGSASAGGVGGGATTGSSAFSTVSPTPAGFTGPRIEQCPPCPVCTIPTQSDQVLRGAWQPTGSLLKPNSAQLIVRIGTCNMKRERSLNPTGVTLSLTVVVSFHNQFITKVDKAYQLRCFYMETEKTVTSLVDVSMLQTTEIFAQAAMPICTYSIRRSSPDGAEIRYAKIGDVVYHRWQCTTTTPAIFGMLVHSCFVDDGKGQRVEVINKTGCSIDPYVIGELHYETALYAYVEAHTFKFADRAVLDFQCAINICVKEGDGCKGITPPACGQRRAKRDANTSTDLESDFFERAVELGNDWDLHAQRLTVVDLDDNIRSEDLARLEKAESPLRPKFASLSHQQQQQEGGQDDFEIAQLSKSTFCLSVAAFGVLISTCTFVLTVSAAVFTTLYFLRHKQLT